MSFHRIFLIGFMGTGKSYLGEKLAAALNRNFYDLDCCIENQTELNVNEIFQQKGEDYFRRIESEILLSWNKEGVISTGGGVILQKQNRDFLKSEENLVIWLNPDWNIIRSRIVNSCRPLVLNRSEQELLQLWDDRRHLYQECADLIFTGTDLRELLEALKSKYKIDASH